MNSFLAIALTCSLLLPGIASAHCKDHEPTKEQRLALAECLKTDKPMKDCKKEVMGADATKECGDSCPMKEHRKKGKKAHKHTEAE